MKSALLIGINYVNTPEQRLYGCINDVEQMKKMLSEIYGYDDIRMLTDTDSNPNNIPTKNNIINELKNIIMKSQQCEEIWIHYSGHGTQITDRNNDEKDGKDECIVPSDYRNGLITDDEIFEIVKITKCPTRIIIDACNSGTGADLGYCWNMVNNQCVFNSNTHAKNENITSPIVMISGCMDPQTSADAWSDSLRKSMGALTCAIWDVLTNKNNITIEDLYISVSRLIIERGYTQRPVLSSAIKDLDLKRFFIRKDESIATSAPISTTTSTSTSAQAIQETSTTSIPSTNDEQTQTENQSILDLENTVTFLQEQLTNVRNENNILRSDNNNIRNENNNLKKDIENKNTINSQLTLDLNKTRTELANEINRLKNEYKNVISLREHNNIKNRLENEIKNYKVLIMRLNSTIAILRRNMNMIQRREFR
jgi:hypothetical protein